MRKSIALVALTLLILPYFIAGVSAVGNSGETQVDPDYALLANTERPELKVLLNCTWIDSPSRIFWKDATPLPPLPGTGWSDQTVSVEVPHDMVVYLYVTDTYNPGDRFEVWKVDGVTPIAGVLVGLTSSVPKNGSVYVEDPDACFADPRFSHGIFTLLLSGGKHYFAFREINHYYGSGAFFVKFCPGPVGGEVIPSPLISIVPVVALLGTISLAVAAPLLSKRLRQR